MKIRRKLAKASVLWCASYVPLVTGSAVSAAISIATVPVGNVNNPSDPDNGFGTVSYEYNIGTYDVTASQYCAFLNAVAATDTYGIYHPNMAGPTGPSGQLDYPPNGNPGIIQSGTSGSYTYSVVPGRGNYPVTDVDYWNATRFANWLDNGQPTGPEGPGTTETGAYDLYATQMDTDLRTIEPTQADKDAYESSQADNDAIVRLSTATWAVTSQNEWYKAAYYDPNKNANAPGGAFYQYPVRSASDTITASEGNFGDVYTDGQTDSSAVGSYFYTPYSGTYDQGGDVYEWNETQSNSGHVQNTHDERGGAFDVGDDVGRASSGESIDQQPFVAVGTTGFRVVQINTFTTGGLLNIANKTVILPNPPAGGLSTIMSQIQSGFNNGAWNGSSGIYSANAAADTAHLTAVGYMINDTGANTGAVTGQAIYNTLGGQPTADGDIDILYTYYGDANLSGSVDGSDYSLIDNGYENHLTGWYNGDFNYDGVVDGSDYTLIDNAFNSQGPAIVGLAADSPTQIAAVELAGPPSPVPEPSAMIMLGIGSLELLRRRRGVTRWLPV